MENLIKDIQEKTGLPADKILEVVTMVTDYMRNALPDDLVQQISQYLGDAATKVDPADALQTASSLAAKALETAATTFSAVVSTVTDVLPTNDNE